MQLDQELHKRLIARDEASIRLFIEKYGPYVYALIWPVCGNVQDTEEATQDTIMKALQHIVDFDFSSNVKTWLYTIAKRTAIDYKRRVKSTDDLDYVGHHVAEVDTSSLLLSNERRAMVESLLDALDEEERELISLYYLKELSHNEISEITGLTLSNIKVKIYRIRQKLMGKRRKFDEII